MRFFEFGNSSGADNIDRFVVILKNIIGRSSSKKAPSKLNWASLNKMVKVSGSELTADYETFKSIYDSSPIVQQLVKNFNADGVELNVPGAPDAEEPTQDGQSSQEKVDQAAASAAPAITAQNQQTAPAQDLTQ